MTKQQTTQLIATTKSPFNVLKRLMMILSFLSESTGRKIGTHEIQKRLAEQNVNIGIRTIQRDLRMMQEIGLPVKVDNHQPMGAKINPQNEWLINLLKNQKL